MAHISIDFNQWLPMVFDDAYICGDCDFVEDVTTNTCLLFTDEYLSTNQWDCLVKCDECKILYNRAKAKIKSDVELPEGDYPDQSTTHFYEKFKGNG